MKVIKLKGRVTRFSGDGRKLGYPTANLNVGTKLPDGVYFGFADLANYKRHPALIFIGTPITIGGKERRVEAHLLDIEDIDYYGQNMLIEVHHFWRPNQKFKSREDLIGAIKTDEAAARAWFQESGEPGKRSSGSNI